MSAFHVDKPSKWIPDVTPKDRTVQVASVSLKCRVAGVTTFFPLAVNEPERDIEYVHQLRVATRRAVAASTLYRKYLPKPARKELDKALKRIRKAAGNARDYDVLLQRYAARDENQPVDWLLQDLRVRRREAQRPLREIYSELGAGSRLSELLEQTLAEMAPRGTSPRFGKWARKQLRRVTREFFAAEPLTLDDLPTLHQFRIRGKDLRYAIELLAPAFPRRLRTKLYPEIEQLQEHLGGVNDHAVAIERLEAWHRQATPERAHRFLAERETERRRLHNALYAFARWWSPRRSKEVARQFDKLVATKP